MKMAPVIPVLVIDEALDPVALAETLVEAGLPVIEVTSVRTRGALAAMRAMAAVEGAVVGAGRFSTIECLARRSMPERSSSFRRD